MDGPDLGAALHAALGGGLGRPPPSPELQLLEDAQAAEELRHRRAVLWWAAVLCTCGPGTTARWRPAADHAPPWATCLVHGQYVLHEGMIL